MKGCRLLIVGCGDIGVPLGLALAAEGAEVYGLRRDCRSLPPVIKPIEADVTQPETLAPLAAMRFDIVLMTLTPAAFNDDGYRQVFVEGVGHLLAVLQSAHLLFVSSTSVYHQSEGEWVDEGSATEPSSFSGKRLLEAEQALSASAIPTTVVRFAGIYGPGRYRLIRQVQEGQGCPEHPPLYTNRIHRDDCVGFLGHLVQRQWSGLPVEHLYLGVDSEPVSMWEIKQWLAMQLGVDAQDMTPVMTPRRSSKRCSNRRLQESGYQLKYPGFREGYRLIVEEYLSTGRQLLQ